MASNHTQAGDIPLPLTPSTTALFVCDVQETFRGVMQSSSSMVRACVFLSHVARLLSLPAVIVSEQYPKAFGRTVDELRSVLFPTGAGAGAGSDAAPPVVTLLEKTRFSMVDEALIASLRSKGIHSVILCGLEAHICIAQSARDLALAGFHVHVAVDAVASQRDEDRSVALARLEKMARVWPTTVEAVAYDLMGDARTGQFKNVLALVKERNEWHAAERAARRAGGCS
jgi:nicotinamidase-related amidase